MILSRCRSHFFRMVCILIGNACKSLQRINAYSRSIVNKCDVCECSVLCFDVFCWREHFNQGPLNLGSVVPPKAFRLLRDGTRTVQLHTRQSHCTFCHDAAGEPWYQALCSFGFWSQWNSVEDDLMKCGRFDLRSHKHHTSSTANSKYYGWRPSIMDIYSTPNQQMYWCWGDMWHQPWQNALAFVGTNAWQLDQWDRDLANLTTWPPMTLGTVEGRSVTLAFWSAVPSFGSDGNYIALLHPYDNGKLREDSKQLTLFCSGPHRSHLSEVRAVGGETNVAYKKHLVFFCDWPAEDAHLESFDVFLEDQWGKQLGIVVAKRKPGLLQQYHTVACMRDVWRSPWTGLRQVPQWMEFHLLHGVDHLLIYTVNIDEEGIVDLYEPYIQSGTATRIHINKQGRTGVGGRSWEVRFVG